MFSDFDRCIAGIIVVVVFLCEVDAVEDMQAATWLIAEVE